MKISTRVAATLVAVLTGTLAACTPAPPGTDYSRCPDAGVGQIRVAVVVDSTDLPVGASATPSVVCVVVAGGANGIDALVARANRLGVADPRLAPSGLVCAIDGQPAAPACGELGPNGYEYWGYYIGGAAWAFAPVGPASRSLSDGAVEGWSFQNGSGTPPETPSAFADLVS